MAATLAVLLLSGVASAQRISVQVSHYKLEGAAAGAAWDKIAIEIPESRREAPTLALFDGHEPELVQECFVSPGRRMSQRAWPPGFPPQDRVVTDILVTKVERESVVLKLVARLLETSEGTHPFAWEMASTYSRPLGKRILIGSGGYFVGLPDGKGDPKDWIDADVLLIRPAPSETEDRCLPPRYAAGVKPPD